MAKKSTLAKALKRKNLVNKFRNRRNELKDVIKSSRNFDEVMDAQQLLAKLPSKSRPSAYVTRCQKCGRQHAVYKKFKLCRICIRQQLMAGNIPGGRKSSW